MSVSKGSFNVILGPMPAIFSESLYVQVTAQSGPGISAPITFSPRSVLTSVPYSLAPWVTSGSNIYYNSGNVGLGTTSPNAKLNIIGGDDTWGNVVPELEIDAPNFPVIRLNATGGPGKNDAGLEVVNTNRRYRVGINTLDKFYLYDVTALQDRIDIVPNGNVGIGMSTPSYKLDVNGIVNATDIYKNGSPLSTSQWTTSGSNIYYNSGNVGIGTTSPSEKLEVSGTVKATTFIGDGSGLTGITGGTGGVSNAGSTTIAADTDADGVGEVALQTHGATRLTVENGGNVGIGTTTPDANAKLDVNGYAFAKAPIVVYDSAAGSGSAFNITWLNDVRINNNIVEKESNNYEFIFKKIGWYRISYFLFFETPTTTVGYDVLVYKNGALYKGVNYWNNRVDGGQVNGTLLVQSNGDDLFKIFASSEGSSPTFNVLLNRNDLQQLSIEYLGAE